MFTINYVISKKQFCKSLENYPHFITENRFYIDGYLFNYLEYKNLIFVSSVYMFSKHLDEYLLKLYIKTIYKIFKIDECNLKFLTVEGL